MVSMFELAEYVSEIIGSEDCFKIRDYLNNVGWDEAIADMKAKKEKSEAS